MPSNTSCPKCGAELEQDKFGIKRYSCGHTVDYKSGDGDPKINCLINQLATERARLAQVKAWVAGVIYYKHEDDDADIISILSDTPEVLAVVEGYAYPRDDGSLWCNVGDKVEGPDWVLDIHKHDNERNPGVPVTVTARTEGGG